MADLGLTTNDVGLPDPFDPTAPPDDMPAVLAALEAAKARDIGLDARRLPGQGPRDHGDAERRARLLAAWGAGRLRACDGACTKGRLPERAEPDALLPARCSTPRARPPRRRRTAALAAGYDAVKEVDESIRVYGVGLRRAATTTAGRRATSPARRSGSWPRWARPTRHGANGAPLMDALSFHPYPNLNTDAPTRGCAINAGLPNLDRLMTAFDDAFAGTGQGDVPRRAPGCARRGRLAGRHRGPGGLHGQRERARRRRGDAGGVLRGRRAARGLRARGRVAQLLPPRRRADRDPVPGRPPSRGRRASRPPTTRSRRRSRKPAGPPPG